MMIFDGHADLLYDVTKWRQAGEDRVFERRHLPRLQAYNETQFKDCVQKLEKYTRMNGGNE